MSYEFDGDRYEMASAHQREWGTKLIDDLALYGNERVLDLGCGDGVLSAELARRVPAGEVVGIDASEGMLETARRRQQGNLHFERRDIVELPFTAEFDVVFSNATLHFVKDHRRLLGNIHRALRDGGTVRCSFGADGNCLHFFQVVRETIRLPEFAPFFHGFAWPYFMPAVEAYQALVAEFPFRNCAVWGENADRYFPDEIAIARWIDQPSIVPFLARVEPGKKQSFRDAVVGKTIALTRQPDGTCFETFRRVNLRARK